MTRRAYLYFVITFLIGIVVGGAGVYYYAWSAGKWRHPWSENAFIHNWTKQLNLAPSQVKQFRAITDDTIKKHAAIDDEKKPQLQALKLEWRARIRQVLTPQQVSNFNQTIRRHEEARKKTK
jgi:Spy/CpxP family protein refolding chaperone